MVHDPVDGLEHTVQESVGVGEAVKVQRLEQELAVAPHLQRPAADPRFASPVATSSPTVAQPQPTHRQSHGPGELPPPAAAHTTAAAAATSPTRSSFQTHTHAQTHTPTITNAGREKQKLLVTQPDGGRAFHRRGDGSL